MPSSTSVLIRPVVSVSIDASTVTGDAPTLATPSRIVTIRPAVVSGVVTLPTPVLPNSTEVVPEVVTALVSVNTPNPKTGSTISASVVTLPGADIRTPTLTVPPPSTLLQNNAEGMASGSILSAGQTGSGDSFDSLAGTVTYDSSQKMHGSQSYHISAIAGVQSEVIWSSADAPYGAARCYIRFNTLPGISQDLMELRNSSGNAAKFCINGGNRFTVQNSIGQVIGTFTSTISAGVWYRIELTCVPGSTTSNGAISGAYYLGDAATQQDSVITSNGTNAGIANIVGARYGKITLATATLDANMDDVAFAPSLLGFIGATSNSSITVTPSKVAAATTIPIPNVQSNYVPPTPSALIQPGVDYEVGVEPFVAAGLNLVTVLPNMAIPGTSLTSDSQGNIIVTVANTTLRGLTLPTGSIKVQAANCWIDMCEVHGYDWKAVFGTGTTGNGWGAGQAQGLIDGMSSAASNLLVTDTTCTADYPQGVWDGVKAWSATYRRVKTRYTSDCCGIFKNFGDHVVTILIDGCDFDKMTYISPDPNHASDSPVSHSHNDCIQIQGAAPGSVIHARYTTLNGWCDPTKDDTITRDSAHPNSAGGYNIHYGTGVSAPWMHSNSGVQVTQGVSTVSGLNFHDNFGSGAAQWWNTGTSQGQYFNFGTVASNKIKKDRRPDTPLSDTIVIPANATGVTITPNNTFPEDGTTIVVKRS